MKGISKTISYTMMIAPFNNANLFLPDSSYHAMM